MIFYMPSIEKDNVSYQFVFSKCDKSDNKKGSEISEPFYY